MPWPQTREDPPELQDARRRRNTTLAALRQNHRAVIQSDVRYPQGWLTGPDRSTRAV
jgi:hypothetical protein